MSPENQSGNEFAFSMLPPGADQLGRLLDNLLAARHDPDTYFTLLEEARSPLRLIEDELSRRYLNRPLPLSERSERSFQQLIAAWRKMAEAYSQCAELQHDASAAHYPVRMAIILHRSLHYIGKIILEHFNARRELPAGIWMDLHSRFIRAEQLGVALIPVNDFLESDMHSNHCMATYVKLLLVDVSSPYSQSTRNLILIRRWAGMWASLVGVQRIDDDIQIPAYVVDLAKDAGLHPGASATHLEATLRRLDTSRLGIQMHHAMNQLRQGAQPMEIGLGEDSSRHVRHLLDQVSRPWTQATAPRRFRRFPASGTARVVFGFDAMHHYLIGDSGAPALPVLPVQHHHGRGQPQSWDAPIEQWEIINYSATGFRLGRASIGQRLAYNQLIAFCPHDSQHFMLGQASWLMQEQSGGLIAGISVLPGLPRPVGVHLLEVPPGEDGSLRPAFLLPAVPAIQAVESIVLPTGIFDSDQVLVMHDGQGGCQVRLDRPLQRGRDFERFSYFPVTPGPADSVPENAP
ncbi:MAG: hypothetical protein RIR00_2281 [Pseudomonadota bacterium]|jgi:hypothetical protein